MKCNKDIPVPSNMAHLERDPRGYPIPFIVLQDRAGAHFVINDQSLVMVCAKNDLCSICGTKLEKIRMYVGGVRNGFHPDGGYVDPPMHPSCAKYALQICPFLAMPSYRGANMEAHTKKVVLEGVEFADTTVIPGKPVMFVAILAKPRKIIAQHDATTGIIQLTFRPAHPYKAVEYWRDGKKLHWYEGRDIRDRVMNGELAPVLA